jgi:hypothetical protein
LIALFGLTIGLFAFVMARHNDNAAPVADVNDTFSAWQVLQEIPTAVWQQFWPLAALVSASLLIGGATAIYLAATKRERHAAIAIAAAMVPAGLAMIDGVARVAPYFSLADAARFLNDKPGAKGQVVFEGALHQGSSLVFYLDQKFYLVNRPDNDDSFVGTNLSSIVLDENEVLNRWADPQVIYLIIDQARLPYWRRIITDRFHIFHQVTASGSCVVLSNEL